MNVLLALTILIIGNIVFAVRPSSAEETSKSSGWSVHDIFSACSGDCGVLILGGQSITRSPLQRIVIGTAPIRFDNTQLIGLAISRPALTYGNWFTIEAEAGAGQRVGNMHEEQFWTALYFRVKPFPTNRFVRTSIAVSTGLDIATGISALERRRSYGHPSLILHNFSPEITFALPDYPETHLVFRIQHRSGLYGLINNGSGTTFLAVGLRHFF
jgi:hypothetical protein